MADPDILIVGGGPVGAALALALRGAEASVALIDPRAGAPAPSDPRPIALSHGSRLILERLGAWAALSPATPIERIHVSQRGGFGQVVLDARATGVPALGYVVDYRDLVAALTRALAAQPRVTTLRGTVLGVRATPHGAAAECELEGRRSEVCARLAVVAEGGALAGDEARTRDYGQCVVTARVRPEMPHRNVAYERFTEEGPLALLPAGRDMALVWSTAAARGADLCTLSEGGFAQALEGAFGSRLGALEPTSPRALYPVGLRVARHETPRVISIGNAAQTLHPVAGQGFNIGLRDAWELADLVCGQPVDALGSAAQLAAFRSRRRLDRGGAIFFTDMLVRLFSNDLAPLRIGRGLGLALLGAVPPARDFLVRRMTFGARG